MHDMLADPITAPAVTAEASDGRLLPLSKARPGDRGVIVEVGPESPRRQNGLAEGELLRRLLEFGFVEGAQVEVLHEGAVRRDPIAVRVDDMRIALRRRDAESVWILLSPR